MDDQWPGQPVSEQSWPGQPAQPAQVATPAAPAALDSRYPPSVDPNTGYSSNDTPSPETIEGMDVGMRAVGRGAVDSAASALGAIAKPSEWADKLVTGTDRQKDMTHKAQDWIRSQAPAASPKESEHPIASTVGGVAGGLPVGIAEWAGGWPIALLQGLESAEEIAKSRGEKPSNMESWRDASIEVVERLALGKVVDLPIGRITKGLVFGGAGGLASEFEGRGHESSAISTVTNFVLGLLGKNITPGSKARLEAAQESAAAGDGPGGMHHLKEALTQDDVASAVAKAARERSMEFPEASGDATHQAAHGAVGDPRLEGPPDPGLPGGEDAPRLRPPSDPGFRERQEAGTENQLAGPEKQKLLGKPRADPEMDFTETGAHARGDPPGRPEPPPDQAGLDFTKTDPRAKGDPPGQREPALEGQPPRPAYPRKRGPAGKDLQHHSLFEYFASRGGLRPDPELTHLFGGKNPFIPGFGRLIRAGGMHLDRAREAAVEARYMHDPGDLSGGLSETTIPELLELIGEESRGRKQYRQGYDPQGKARPQEAAERERDINASIDTAMEEIGLDPARHLEPEVRARIYEMMDKEGETDALAAYERAIMEGSHEASESGDAQRIDEHIPGWDVPDDTGTAPQAGRSLATVPKPQMLASRATSRDLSQGDRASAGAGDARLGDAGHGGRGGGRFPGREYGEWNEPERQRQLEGPPPKGTFPDGPERMGLDDPRARDKAKDTIATVITQRDRVNAMQRRHWDEGEELFKGIPDELRIRMLTNFMQGRDPLIGIEGKKAPPAANGFTRYSKRGVYVDVPQAEARSLTRDRLNEMLDQEGRPLERGGVGENHAKALRDWFKKSAEEQDIQHQSEKLGAEIDYEYRQNYWHLMWKDEAKAQASGAAHGGGRPNFTKHKVFEDPSAGMAAGLELKTTNPAVLGVARQEAGNMAIARVMAMKDLVEDGLAVEEKGITKGKRDARLPSDVQQWKVVDVGGTRYRVHPEAHLMLQRGLGIDQKTIAEMFHLNPRGKLAKGVGGAYSVLIKARNATIPLKLAFSAFHALHVLGIDSAQPIAAALHQKLNRRISNAEFLKSLADHKMLESYAYGAKAAENWPKPFEELTPIQQVEQNLMIAGGYTPGKPSVYEVGATRALRRQMNDVLPSLKQKLDKDGAGILARAWKATPEYAKAAGMLIGRGIEAIQGPMFDDWIPAIKTAAYLNQAKLLVQARPELLEGTTESSAALRRELQKVRRSIDNRFGEMQYDKEFMNPLLRKSTMGAMLSVGWNLGFLREFGGGMLVDPGKNIYHGARNLFGDEKIHNEISTRTVYAGIYVAEAMMLTGLMTYMFTGQKPDDIRDLVYPKHADGTRSTTMWFTREFLGAYFHMINEGVERGAINLAASKLNPLLQSFWQAMTNRDYFGHQIYDANASPFKALEQASAWLGKQVFEPISFSGLEQQGDDPARIAESFAGFNPAPAYVERSRTLSEIYRASSDLLGGKTAYDEVDRANTMRDLARLYRKADTTGDEKDIGAYEAARDKYAEKYPERLGASGKNLRQSEKNWSRPEGLGTFSRIGTVSPETQQRIFDEAPLSEKAWLQQGLLKRLRPERSFEVTPEMVASFPEKDQDNFLKVIGPAQRGAYLPYVTPKLQAQYGAKPPAPNPQERATVQ